MLATPERAVDVSTVRPETGGDVALGVFNLGASMERRKSDRRRRG
jgi:hypothetical protein